MIKNICDMNCLRFFGIDFFRFIFEMDDLLVFLVKVIG